jgi:DNA-binding response OmpR family regulator
MMAASSTPVMTLLLLLRVDDEPDMTDLVRFHCSKARYEVLTAASGREAIETVNCRRPDLGLPDLMLPDLDGFAVCGILRRDAATATIPIVILTSRTTADPRNTGLELGVLDQITKPFGPKDSVDRVSNLLRLRPSSA